MCAAGLNRSRLIAMAPFVIVAIVIAVPRCKVLAQIFNENIIDSPDPISEERFGHSMAIDGKYLVVGASGVVQDTAVVKGRVFVYKYKENKWKKQATLSYDKSQVGDAFGHSVAIRGDWIVVGSPHPFLDGQGRLGRVLIYEKPKDGWRTTNNPDWVVVPDANGGDSSFGSAVAVNPIRGSNDSWIIIGDSQDDRAVTDGGVVYVFQKKKSIVLSQIIQPPIAATKENFGNELQIDDDLLVVGAPSLPHKQTGAVYTYQLSTNNKWKYKQTINGFDSQFGDHFGRSVSVWRDEQKTNGWMVVGATGDDDYGEHSGSAYIYQWVRDGSRWGWRFVQKFNDPNSQNGDHIGFSTSLNNDIMAIGAPFPGKNHNNILYFLQYFNNLHRWKLIAQHETPYPDSNDYTGTSMVFHTDKNGVTIELLAGKPQREVGGTVEAGAVLILSQ